MRAATGGLAASDRTTPPSMTAPSATRLNRSIVHHHAANGVRSTRETILEFPVRGWAILWQDDSRLRSVLRKYGCDLVKKKFRWRNSATPLLGPRASRPLFPLGEGRKWLRWDARGPWRKTSPLRPSRRDHPRNTLHEFAE